MYVLDSPKDGWPRMKHTGEHEVQRRVPRGAGGARRQVAEINAWNETWAFMRTHYERDTSWYAFRVRSVWESQGDTEVFTIRIGRAEVIPEHELPRMKSYVDAEASKDLAAMREALRHFAQTQRRINLRKERAVIATAVPTWAYIAMLVTLLVALVLLFGGVL